MSGVMKDESRSSLILETDAHEAYQEPKHISEN